MPGPIWRDRVFISEFCDAYLESTDTEGGDTSKLVTSVLTLANMEI